MRYNIDKNGDVQFISDHDSFTKQLNDDVLETNIPNSKALAVY